jgi:hypothetical protein
MSRGSVAHRRRSRQTGAAGAPRPAGTLPGVAKDTAIEVSAAALVLRAPGTATAAEVRSAAAAASLQVVGLPDGGDNRSVADLVGAGAVPRRSLCGIELETDGGDIVRSGGGVLKDVTGYDLAALALGAGGRLGRVVAVHLRLAPAEAVLPPAGPAPGPRDVSDLAASLAPLARAGD